LINKSTIDQIYEASLLEEVISDFISLKKSGANYKGLSPFTNERTPSFMVSPVKQIWKDFSSGKGGNVVAFLMEHEHFTYPEALRYLAKKYNIEIEETQQSEQDKEKYNEKESLFLLSEFAMNNFINNLWEKNEGKAIGLTYFKERGFSAFIIKKFCLGYSFQSRNIFFNSAKNSSYTVDNIKKSGLVIFNENKEGIDRFRGRVIFPIRSLAGRVQGFGGRILSNKSKVAKYINSPESEIYVKSKVLYGVFEAKQTIAKKDLCYLVEGYTDVIQMHQNGIENVVSSSGTALSSEQIQIIRRLTRNITVLFDGDEAGLRAALRGVDLILEQGMNVQICVFPKGEDPDSFAKVRTKEEVLNYFETNSKDFIQFKTSLLLEESGDDPVKKASTIREIILSISKIPDLIQQEIYLKKCSESMNISEEVLFNSLAQEKNKKKHSSPSKINYGERLELIKKFSSVKKESNAMSFLERQIINILLHYGGQEVSFDELLLSSDEKGSIIEEPKVIKSKVYEKIFLDLQEDEVELVEPNFLKLYKILINSYQRDGELKLEKVTHQINPELGQVLADLILEDEVYQLHDWKKKNIYVKDKKKNIGQLVSETILSLRRLLIDQKIKALIDIAKLEENKSENPDFLSDIIQYQNLKKLLSKKLNRVI
jgi:DNA primase